MAFVKACFNDAFDDNGLVAVFGDWILRVIDLILRVTGRAMF